MDIVRIEYAGAEIEMPSFLADIWPDKLPLDKWPDFCGPKGFLGKAVPETITGVCISASCFIHDIMYAIAPDTVKWFVRSNIIFNRNNKSLVMANYDKSRYTSVEVLFYTSCFFHVVQMLGKGYWKSDYEDRIVTPDPMQHPVVKRKLHKLAMSLLCEKQYFQITHD